MVKKAKPSSKWDIYKTVIMSECHKNFPPQHCNRNANIYTKAFMYSKYSKLLNPRNWDLRRFSNFNIKIWRKMSKNLFLKNKIATICDISMQAFSDRVNSKFFKPWPPPSPRSILGPKERFIFRLKE